MRIITTADAIENDDLDIKRLGCPANDRHHEKILLSLKKAADESSTLGRTLSG
jgi:hypothetical protein